MPVFRRVPNPGADIKGIMKILQFRAVCNQPSEIGGYGAHPLGVKHESDQRVFMKELQLRELAES
eukprot:8864880-Alexandrium_andersonii.AAC.1